MWLSGTQKPDFRKNNIRVLKGLFKQVVQICQKLGMVTPGLVAIDGTKGKAATSDYGAKTKDALREALKTVEGDIERHMAEGLAIDKAEDAIYVEDRTERGGKLRILAIIDEYTRECLAIRVAPSIPALAVVGVLEWLFLTRGAPKHIRSDNGPEFVAKAVCQWLKESGCQTLFINPSSLWENDYIESFFDKLRDECLNREVFRNGWEAQAIVENWR